MQEQSFDVRSLLSPLRRRMGIGLAVAVWVVAAAATLALVLPNLYSASVVVLVEPAANTNDTGYINPAEQAARLSTRLEKIQQAVLSQPSLEAMIQRLKLWPDLQARGELDTAANRLRSAVVVQADQLPDSGVPTRTLSITYNAPDPTDAATVTNALAAAWVEANQRLQEQSMSESARFLKAQVDSVKQKLDAENGRINAFSRQHTGELPQQDQANIAVLGRLNSQLQANLSSQQQLREQQIQLQTQVATGASTPDLTHSPAAQLADLQQQLMQLQTRYTDEYPDVIRLKQEIATLKKNLASGAAGPAVTNAADPAPGAAPVGMNADRQLLADVNGQLNDLKTKEATLRTSIQQYEARLEQAPETGQQLSQLSRDYQATSDVYDTLLKQYEQAQLSSLLEARATSDTLQVSQPAQPPAEPAAPNRALLVAGGVVLGLVLGLVAIFAADQFDSSFHSIEDLKAFTSVPVLATIPRIVTRRDTWRRRGRLVLRTVGVLAVLLLVAAASYHFGQHGERVVRLLAKVHV